MNVFVVDDDIAVCHSLTVVVSALGHDVQGFVDPLHAIDAVTPALDLVISDVNMPAIDGFGVARGIVQKLGESPPRVLLISGGHQEVRLRSTPATAVMGLVCKPFRISQLIRIVSLIQRTRQKCPGCIPPLLCPNHRLPEPGGCPTQAGRDICRTSRYALCPLYDDRVGSSLRNWIRNGADHVV